ncbi:MAG: hypothetical protein K2Q18_16280, partial [Bdellovibrionales bacterium]|nr:hypothetical protein [Bdellovibrionales bacterium]
MKFLAFLAFTFSLQAFGKDVPVALRPCSESMVNTTNLPKNNDLNFQEAWCLFATSADLLSFHEEAPLSMYDLGLQYFNTDT